MSVAPTSKDDPRDDSLEVPYSLPKSWYVQSNDGLSTSGMMLAGLIMVTRNRYLAWPSLALGINSIINQHPLRQKEVASGWSGAGLSAAALLASYIPVVVIAQNPI